jgi:hypothetical protein
VDRYRDVEPGIQALPGRQAQWRSDSRESGQPKGQSTGPCHFGTNTHQFLDSLDLLRFDSDAALPLGTALHVINGNRLSAQHEQAAIRLSEPVIECRHGDSETLGGFKGSQ